MQIKTSENCKNYKKCGACQLRNMSYEEQLSFKMSKVIKCVGKFGHVEEIVPMDNPSRYRNKSQAAYFEQGGRVFAGIYQSNSQRIVKIDDCPVESKMAVRIIKEIANIMNELHLHAYNPGNDRGFLRHVLVRHGFTSRELMVVIVSRTAVFPKRELFLSLLTERFPQITTIVHNINDTSTPLWMTDKEKVIYGDGYIYDRLCSCDFRISPRSFYQINPVQTEKMYTAAMDFAHLSGKEKVLDAYSGIGTIGIIAAKQAREVHCVESNASAVKDAKFNAKLSKVHNISFFNDDSADFVEKAARMKNHYDVAFVDPPRAGCSKQFLSRLAFLAPSRIVYVSCNPETLGRDLGFLKNKGYKINVIQPYDMFPHTTHVETVVLLSGKNIGKAY